MGQRDKLKRKLFGKSSEHVNSGGKDCATSSLRSESGLLTPLTAVSSELPIRPETPLSDVVVDDSIQRLPSATVEPSSPSFEESAVETPDLWLLAFGRSGLDNDQSSVLFKPSAEGETEPWSPIKFVQDVKEITSDRCVACKKSGWIPKDSRSKTPITQRAETILMAVLELKDFISEGLKCDVTGYGATAWSIITFGLQLAQNDLDRTESIFEASAFLAELLARYASIELHYGDPDIDDWPQLQDSIVSVYAAVLKYAFEVRSASQSGLHERFVASFRALVENPLTSLKAEIEAQEASSARWLTHVAHQYRKKESEAILSEVSKTLSTLKGVSDTIDQLWLDSRNIEDDRLRDWFCREGATKHQEIQTDLLQYQGEEGLSTGDWLFESDDFKDWLRYPQQFLLLHGRAGCGKSYLCSIIVEYIREQHREDSRKLVLYRFMEDTKNDTNQLEDVLRSLIRQMLTVDVPIPAFVKEAAKTHRQMGSFPKFDQLSDLVCQLMQKGERDIFMIIDGLDHTLESTLHPQRKLLFGLIRDLQQRNRGKLHLLVSTKHDAEVYQAIQEMGIAPPVPVDVYKNAATDLTYYVQYHIKHNVPKFLPSSDSTEDDDTLGDEIFDALMESQSCSFLWMNAVLREIYTCLNRSQVETILRSLPSTIEDIYTKALLGILPKDREMARSMFELLLCNSGKVDTGLALDYAGLFSASQVVQICSSTLLQSNQSESIVEFSHPSVEQFLLLDKTIPAEGARYFTFDKQQLQARITIRCLDRLTSGKRGLFLDYASKNLLHHCRRAWEVPDDVRVPRHFLEAFATPSAPAFLNWRRNLYEFQYLKDVPVDKAYPTAFHVFIDRGDYKTALAALDNDPTDCDVVGINGTPLQVAASKGHIQLATALIELGADVDAPPGPTGTAIYRACLRHEHIEILQLLLAQNPTTTLDLPHRESEDSPYQTPLYAAIMRGNERSVQLLLEAGARPNSCRDLVGDELQAAAALGHESIVKILLQYGCDPKQMHGPYCTARLAALHGLSESHETIARMLEPVTVAPTTQGSIWRYASMTAEALTLSDGLQWVQLHEADDSVAVTKRMGLMTATASQRRTAWAYYYTMPTAHLRNEIQTRIPTTNGSSLWRQLEIAFGRGGSNSGYNTIHAYYKYSFRAMIHHVICHCRGHPGGRLLNGDETEYLASLLAIWNRTEHYEELAMDQYGQNTTAPLHASLLDLFTHLLYAMNWYYHEHNQMWKKGPRIESVEETVLQNAASSMLDKVKILEQDTHIQANLHLQCKQTVMLNQLQRDQSIMAHKIEEAVTEKMKVLEENMMQELRYMRKALLDSVAAPPQSSTKDAGQKDADRTGSPDIPIYELSEWIKSNEVLAGE